MTGGPSPGPGEATDRERRRRLRARVFGEEPDSSRDERGEAWGEEPGEGDSEEWLRRQVPPHHEE